MKDDQGICGDTILELSVGLHIFLYPFRCIMQHLAYV